MAQSIKYPLLQRMNGLLSSKLTRASGLMFASVIGGGILGYTFQILMGRMLSVADYGVFITLMALVTVAGVPLNTLSMVVSRRASDYRANGQRELVAAMFWWVNERVLWTVILVVLGTLPLISWLRDYFHLESFEPLWLLLVIFFTMSFLAINLAFLQAQQYFHWFALTGLASHGFKILFCAALIHFAGLKLNGALAGVMLALFGTWLFTYLPIRRTVTRTTVATSRGGHLSISAAIPVLIANLAFAVMTQLDIILVNHFYNTQQAGTYAAAAILGKAVMYLPGAITMAMFPMVAENESRSQSSAHLFVNAMALTTILSGAAALFYYFFAAEIMNLFYGQKYEGASELLELYGFAIMPMTLVMVSEHFLIAKGRVIFAYVMMLGIPFVFLAVQNYHAHLIDMIYILTACGWGLALVGFGVIGMQYLFGRLKN